MKDTTQNRALQTPSTCITTFYLQNNPVKADEKQAQGSTLPNISVRDEEGRGALKTLEETEDNESRSWKADLLQGG